MFANDARLTQDALLAAHIEYELQQYAPARLPAAIRDEVTALYTWLATVKVADLLPPPQITAWLQRNVLQRPLPAALVDFIQENLEVALELLQDDQTLVPTILPKPAYDRAVVAVGEMGDFRRQVIHEIVSSSVYSRLVANVLYFGIKTFLVTDNGMARAIPGASSLLRLSQNALNATVPQAEKNVDKQLIAFIDDNIQQTVAESEAFLDRTLDTALVQRMGEELWESLRSTTLARLTGSLDKQAVTAGSDVIQEIWQQLRTTTIAEDILEAVVRSFYLRYGKQDVRTLLEQLDLGPETVAEELLALAAPLFEQARAGGYLEARLRARLAPFYEEYFAAAGSTPENSPEKT
jgi:hypothetical protein